MKRKILLATLVASLGLMLSSCDKEDGIVSSEGNKEVQISGNQ